nr:G patch domain-containing protein 8-like [Penaeus vannamei]
MNERNVRPSRPLARHRHRQPPHSPRRRPLCARRTPWPPTRPSCRGSRTAGSSASGGGPGEELESHGSFSSKLPRRRHGEFTNGIADEYHHHLLRRQQSQQSPQPQLQPQGSSDGAQGEDASEGDDPVAAEVMVVNDASDQLQQERPPQQPPSAGSPVYPRYLEGCDEDSVTEEATLSDVTSIGEDDSRSHLDVPHISVAKPEAESSPAAAENEKSLGLSELLKSLIIGDEDESSAMSSSDLQDDPERLEDSARMDRLGSPNRAFRDMCRRRDANRQNWKLGIRSHSAPEEAECHASTYSLSRLDSPAQEREYQNINKIHRRDTSMEAARRYLQSDENLWRTWRCGPAWGRRSRGSTNPLLHHLSPGVRGRVRRPRSIGASGELYGKLAVFEPHR